jgi:hypothetical protein
MTSLSRNHRVMLWPRREPTATLDDVVELLTGIGQTAMGISAQLNRIVAILEDEDDEQPDS